MKGIRLSVTVKYYVRVAMTVTDEVYKSLEHMEQKYPFGFDCDIVDRECDAATDFLADNISEQDAWDWEYQIDDIEEIKED